MDLPLQAHSLVKKDYIKKSFFISFTELLRP